jgi:ankyrin repeat protein
MATRFSTFGLLPREENTVDDFTRFIRKNNIANIKSVSQDKLKCLTTDGNTLLHIAILMKNLPVVQYLALFIRHDIKNDYGQTALDVAIQTQQTEIVTILCNCEQDKTYRNEISALNLRNRDLIEELDMTKRENRSIIVKVSQLETSNKRLREENDVLTERNTKLKTSVDSLMASKKR